MGISQAEFSKSIGCSQSAVSHFEVGRTKITGDQLDLARKALGIDKVPFLDGEDEIYKARLHLWGEILNAGRIDEAREMREELASITKLSFKKELLMTFHLFDIKLLLIEKDFATSQELLDQLQHSIKDATIENKHHFHFNLGNFNIYKGDYSLALENYLICCDLSKDKDVSHMLYFNIALCYHKLGMYFSAITTLERIYHSHYDKISSMFSMRMDDLLGVNYLLIGRTSHAKQFFDICLKKAKINNNEMFMAFSLHNHGCVCLNLKEYKNALEFFKKTYSHTKEGLKVHYENMYYEALCLIAMRSLSKSKVRLSHAKAIAASRESKHYMLLYDSLECLLTIRENTSIEYIEQTTLTYLIEKKEYFRVLEYCEVLADILIKKNSKMKAMEIKELAHKLRLEIMQGGNAE